MAGTAVVVAFIIGVVVVIVLGYIIGIFNGLIRLKNNIEKSWSNINVLMKQRHDELPKIINAVKGYMKHEKTVLTDLTKARTEFLKAKDIHKKAALNNQISSALKTIFAVAENYPNLKASENFQQLQARISGLENEISDRREFYNDSVNVYNIRIHSIPDFFVARMMGYMKKELFRTTPEEVADVKVEF